jgi:hypothetical protein
VGDLDGDVAIQAGVVGSVDFTHAAFSDGSEDFIGAEFVARREPHMIQST